jgi:hypothetical protein
VQRGLNLAAVGAYGQNGQILPPKLTDLELEALRQIAEHPATRNIPYRLQSRLRDIGYAKEVLGGLVLTNDGLQRIAIDREHSACPDART